MQIKYQKANELDGEILAEIRVRAMKPSLEAIGRFDPTRARDRFLESYSYPDTTKIYLDTSMVGFYSVNKKSDHLYLSHLYVLPEYQGHGIGGEVLNRVKALAETSCHVVRLGALRGSTANHFYISNGFKFTHEEEWDLYYEWKYC